MAKADWWWYTCRSRPESTWSACILYTIRHILNSVRITTLIRDWILTSTSLILAIVVRAPWKHSNLFRPCTEDTIAFVSASYLCTSHGICASMLVLLPSNLSVNRPNILRMSLVLLFCFASSFLRIWKLESNLLFLSLLLLSLLHSALIVLHHILLDINLCYANYVRA